MSSELVFLTFTHFFVEFCRDRRIRASSKILARSLFSFPCFSQILSSTPETWLQGMGTFISEKCHWAQVLVPATVYLILATVYWHLWYWVPTINWTGQKGPLQFIGSLGHYFTPAVEWSVIRVTGWRRTGEGRRGMEANPFILTSTNLFKSFQTCSFWSEGKYFSIWAFPRTGCEEIAYSFSNLSLHDKFMFIHICVLSCCFASSSYLLLT